MRSNLPALGLALAALMAALAASTSASAQNLVQLAKQHGCTGTPVVVEGTDLYKCQAQSGMSYFNGPPSAASSVTTKKGPGVPASSPGVTRASASPSSFPRVDSNTQRERDDVRKRVLTEELATEVRMMVESEVAMKSGGTPLPDEALTSPKYIDRQGKLRSTVENHSKNIQALTKELERLR